MKSLNFGLTGLKLGLAALVATTSLAANAGTSDELESLGSNQNVRERAAKLESRSRVGIVQNRTVDRNWRLEVGTLYGPATMGDTYLNTQMLGGEAHLHVTPKFSLGVRYSKMFNSLTAEGEARFAEAERQVAANPHIGADIPDIDHPEDSVMGLANWYMFYGKMNFFDLKTIQFDIYSLAGYGQMTLASGTTPTWTAGAGIGFWLAQHLTSRVELRYQNYQDQVYTGSRDLHLFIATFGIGILL